MIVFAMDRQVLLGSASSFVQRMELAFNGTGDPGCYNSS